MKLIEIQLDKIQCFEKCRIPIHDLTILIGENDCGKSTVLKSLNFFLDHKPLPIDMFREINRKKSTIAIITLIFSIENSTVPKQFLIDNKLTIKKEYVLNEDNSVSQSTLVKCFVFERSELNRILDLKAPELKILCTELGLEYQNVTDSKTALLEYVKTNFDALPKTGTPFNIQNWSEVSNVLPLVEYYNSSSYGNPQELIEKTMESIYRRNFYDYDEDGNESLLSEYRQKKNQIDTELNKVIKEQLNLKIKQILPKVRDISGEFDTDFASGFSLSSLLADFGTGPRPINNIGEGSKKRLFLGILEWDKEIRSRETKKPVIRLYDEPDASLHYKAQKEMYYMLNSISHTKQANLQVILSTHSISMIDRAPAAIINYIVNTNDLSQVKFLESGEDTELKEFLEDLSELSGIKNSSLFFEKCYLVVEGQTEENAIPILYKKYYGKSLLEDGVILINLETNSAWKCFLKLLGKNKANCTVMLLDNDTQQDSALKVTKASLGQIAGFNSPYLDKNVFFIGTNEFEDSFSEVLICRTLNKYYPKKETDSWQGRDLSNLREGKFSDGLLSLVNAYKKTENLLRDYCRKPELGKLLAEEISREEIESNRVLIALFRRINEIIS